MAVVGIGNYSFILTVKPDNVIGTTVKADAAAIA
jgi:hypothetical protein